MARVRATVVLRRMLLRHSVLPVLHHAVRLRRPPCSISGSRCGSSPSRSTALHHHPGGFVPINRPGPGIIGFDTITEAAAADDDDGMTERNTIIKKGDEVDEERLYRTTRPLIGSSHNNSDNRSAATGRGGGLHRAIHETETETEDAVTTKRFILEEKTNDQWTWSEDWTPSLLSAAATDAFTAGRS